MAIPNGWAFSYVFGNGNLPNFSTISDARGVCPHCGIATTFQVRNVDHDAANRTIFYLLLACNSAPCRKTIYVHTSVTRASGVVRSVPHDLFYVHPSRNIEPPHISIPAEIADDWLEAQGFPCGWEPKSDSHDAPSCVVWDSAR